MYSLMPASSYPILTSDHEKSFEEALRSLQKFGEEGVLRFREWKNLFE